MKTEKTETLDLERSEFFKHLRGDTQVWVRVVEGRVVVEHDYVYPAVRVYADSATAVAEIAVEDRTYIVRFNKMSE